MGRRHEREMPPSMDRRHERGIPPIWANTGWRHEGDTPHLLADAIKRDFTSGERLKKRMRYCLLIKEFSFAIFMKFMNTDRETLSETILFVCMEEAETASQWLWLYCFLYVVKGCCNRLCNKEKLFFFFCHVRNIVLFMSPVLVLVGFANSTPLLVSLTSILTHVC